MSRTSDYNDEEERETAFQMYVFFFPHICQHQLGLRVMRTLFFATGVTIYQGLTGQHRTIMYINGPYLSGRPLSDWMLTIIFSPYL